MERFTYSIYLAGYRITMVSFVLGLQELEISDLQKLTRSVELQPSLPGYGFGDQSVKEENEESQDHDGQTEIRPSELSGPSRWVCWTPSRRTPSHWRTTLWNNKPSENLPLENQEPPLKNQTLEDQNAALRDQSLGPGGPASAHGWET